MLVYLILDNFCSHYAHYILFNVFIAYLDVYIRQELEINSMTMKNILELEGICPYCLLIR